MLLIQAVDRYLSEVCPNKGKTRTRKIYALRRMLEQLEVYAGRKPELEDLTLGRAQAWVQAESKTKSGHTVLVDARVIKHFARFVAEEITGGHSPLRKLQVPAEPERVIRKRLTKEEVERIKRAALRVGDNAFERQRNHTIVLVALATGLRASELRLLEERQLKEGDNKEVWRLYFSAVRRKRGKSLDAILPVGLNESIFGYLNTRQQMIHVMLGKLNEAERAFLPFFPDFPKTRQRDPDELFMPESAFCRLIQRIGNEAGVPDLHWHRFRYTCVRDLLEQSQNNYKLVQRVLGHSSPVTTMRYDDREQEELEQLVDRIQGQADESAGTASRTDNKSRGVRGKAVRS